MRDWLLTSRQVERREWVQTDLDGNIVSEKAIGYSWEAGGRLQTRHFFPNDEKVSYRYDALGRIDRVIDGTTLSSMDFEAYTRDVVGNPPGDSDGSSNQCCGPTGRSPSAGRRELR